MKESFFIRLILTFLAIFALGYSMGYYHAAGDAKVRVSIALERQ